jgi:pimeloyl-ACP methyl ester carboxylesterase
MLHVTTPAPTTERLPAWFRDAIAQQPEVGSVEVAGVPINVLAWGSPELPSLTLVHGGAAHAQWWSFVAPQLASQHRVVALDLSGHGDSGHRPVYDPGVWGEEVMAATEAFGGTGRPVIAGHSMGGFVTMLMAERWGASLAGAVLMDSPLRRPDPESEEGRGGAMFRNPKVYDDLDTAVAHFHLVPPQPRTNEYLIDHVGRRSLRRSDGGWTWKFDPRVFVSRTGPTSPEAYATGLSNAACRVAVVTGQRSAIIDDEVRDYMAELLTRAPGAAQGVPFIEIPEAHHHLMFDRPLELVTALRAIVGTWRAT